MLEYKVISVLKSDMSETILKAELDRFYEDDRWELVAVRDMSPHNFDQFIFKRINLNN